MENEDTFKKQFYLEGLCCANCAAKIERKVSELEEINSANLDFVSKKLTIELIGKSNVNLAETKIKSIVRQIEDEVNVIDADEKIDKKVEDNKNKIEFIRFAIGVVVFIFAYVLKLPKTLDIVLYVVSYLIVGGEVVLKALKNIGKGQIFDENFLMAVATIGAFAIKEFPEAVSVMIFYQIGEFFQDAAVEKSRKSISSLIEIKPEYANLKVGLKVEKVSPEKVKVGSTIVIKPGERVPLDGIVLDGKSSLDTSAVTGESMVKKVSMGNEIFSGSINKEGLLHVKVTKEFKESTVSKILELTQNASSKKAPTEKFITKFAKYYTPIVVFSAIILAVVPPIILGGSFSKWIYRSLIFLVASCPCAIVLSVPLSFFGGIGSASKNGILVKGGNYLENLNKVDTVVFDKTGTLTKGNFSVGEIYSANGFSKQSILKLAALVESFSNHPIAVSICNEYEGELDKTNVLNYKEESGYGVCAKVSDKLVLVGNANFMKKEKIDFFENDPKLLGTIVHVAVDGVYGGYIVISDKVKEDSSRAIEALKNRGIKTVMLTGDNEKAAKIVASKINIDEVYYELLPQDKVKKIEEIYKKSPNSKIAFVGDGINDAPVLARVDVGISMGSIGSDAAVEASDVVIMNDEPYKIYTAVRISNKTNKIVWQNIVFSIGVKAVVLILGALGFANIWAAVFADTGVALIAVVNSLRTMKIK